MKMGTPDLTTTPITEISITSTPIPTIKKDLTTMINTRRRMATAVKVITTQIKVRVIEITKTTGNIIIIIPTKVLSIPTIIPTTPKIPQV